MPEPVAFSRQNRGVLIALLSILLGYLAVRLVMNPTYIADPQPNRPLREPELADRIDPNTADVPMLAALPGLGMKRAADIVAYREQFRRDNPGRPAFAHPQDLLKIRGIGYAMMTQLTPYLIFPAPDRPAADPTTRPPL